MTTIAVDNRASLLDTLAWVIATFAAAGGLIHLEAVLDHRDLVVIAVGFGAMAIGQLALAGVMVMRPTRTIIIGVGAVHALIALIWIMSRTVGLPFVPGAEEAAQVGVADVVANTFSIAVVGVTIVALSIDRSGQEIRLRPRTADAVKMVALVGALILTVAALSETHTHTDHEDSLPTSSHSHEHQSSP